VYYMVLVYFMKKQGSSRAEQRARRALTNVLPPTVDIRVSDGAKGRLIVNGTPLRIRWIGHGWPADVTSALDGLAEQPDVVLAVRMSPGAQQRLAEAGIGWADESGAAEIAVGPILISRTGRPFEAPRAAIGWSRAALGVAEAILCGTRPVVTDTVEATGLSRGSCQKALRFFADRKLVEVVAERGRYSSRKLTDHDQLLEAYSSAVAETSRSPSLQVGLIWRDPVATLVQVGAKWEAADVAWACTSALAAYLLAPYLASVTTVDAYVGRTTIPGLESAAAAAGLQPMEGGRLTLRPFPTTTSQTLSEETAGVRLVPWPRAYSDLRPIGVRGEEAAEHLREVMRAR